jgi:hypothetical protein
VYNQELLLLKEFLLLQEILDQLVEEQAAVEEEEEEEVAAGEIMMMTIRIKEIIDPQTIISLQITTSLPLITTDLRITTSLQLITINLLTITIPLTITSHHKDLPLIIILLLHILMTTKSHCVNAAFQAFRKKFNMIINLECYLIYFYL